MVVVLSDILYGNLQVLRSSDVYGLFQCFELVSGVRKGAARE